MPDEGRIAGMGWMKVFNRIELCSLMLFHLLAFSGEQIVQLLRLKKSHATTASFIFSAMSIIHFFNSLICRLFIPPLAIRLLFCLHTWGDFPKCERIFWYSSIKIPPFFLFVRCRCVSSLIEICVTMKIIYKFLCCQEILVVTQRIFHSNKVP